jgi:hypothetical protein
MKDIEVMSPSLKNFFFLMVLGFARQVLYQLNHDFSPFLS